MHPYKRQAEGNSTMREGHVTTSAERERKREMQSHYSVGFEDRQKDYEPRKASCATTEVGKVISLWGECSLANPLILGL